MTTQAAKVAHTVRFPRPRVGPRGPTRATHASYPFARGAQPLTAKARLAKNEPQATFSN
jgi:hypothetical protein